MWRDVRWPPIPSATSLSDRNCQRSAVLTSKVVRFLLPVLIAVLAFCAPASASTVYEMHKDGSVTKKDDPYLPASSQAAPGATGTAPRATARAAKSKRTVTAELRKLRDSGQITPESYTSYATTYNASKRLAKSLRGTRRTQIGAVVKNTEAIAASGRLTATRAPALFLTLERNRAWWSAGKGIGAGARISFTGSEIVWQYYPGQGIQIQWLGTFGKANGYLKAKNVQNTKLKLLLDESVALAAARAGGIGWEYLFKFGGGSPPWVSGMAQATGIQALGRAAIKYMTSDPQRYSVYLDAARKALGIYNVAPPEGVRVDTPSGAHYLIYSYSRGLRVQNAFTQTISGLHDFVELTGDPNGLQIFLAGERQLRAETPTYDTGAWSMYSNQSEANLNYHNESTNFLATLCKSLQEDQVAAATMGGFAPGGIPALDPAIYCDTATRYRGYLTTAPVLAVRNSSLRKGKLTALNFSLSKISKVSITVRRSGSVIFSRTLTLSHGNRSVRFKPSKSGTAEVTLNATDLAGNRGTATGTVTIR